MKFKINRNELERGLSRVKAAIDGRAALPIIRGVKMEVQKPDALYLTATNLDNTIRVKVEVEAAVDGVTAVDYNRLAAVVSSLPECPVSAQFKTKGKSNFLELVCDGCRSLITAQDPAEYPRIAEVKGGKAAKIEAKEIAGAFNFVRHAFSDDDTRKNLMGALVEVSNGKIVAVGTDGKRMAVYGGIEEPGKDTRSAIIPAKLVNAILEAVKNSSGVLSVTTDGNQILVEDGELWSVQGKLYADAPYKWRQVVPRRADNHIAVDRYELADNFSRASRGEEMAGVWPCVKMTLKAGRIVIDSNGAECEMHTEMPCKYDGEEVVILLNPDYVVQSLNAATDDEVRIGFNDGYSPITVESANGPVETIMPLRVSGN